MHKTCLLLLIFFFCFACKQKKNQSEIAQPIKDTTAFFPVNDLLLADINDVKQTPYFIYKITTKKKSRDSVSLSKEEFLSLANLFLQKKISTPELKPLYKESSFHDLSTSSYTIVYTATDTSLPVKEVTILLDDATNKLKHVFIRNVISNNDSTLIEQYDWKASKSFRINRYIKRKDNSETKETNFINWNDPQ